VSELCTNKEELFFILDICFDRKLIIF